MKTKRVFLLALLLLCVSCFLFLSGATWFAAKASVQLWRGFYTVLVSDQYPPGKVEDRLSRAGLSTITSENSPVTFNDFASDATVPVSRLRTRFVPEDPRYDPYMKQLASYFHQGRWNIFYARMSAPPPIAYAVLARVLSGLKWRSADFNWRAALVCTALLFLVGFSVLVRTRRPVTENWALLAGLLPWLPAAMSGGYTGTLAGALIYFGWAGIVELGYPLFRYYLDYRAIETERWKPLGAVIVGVVFSASVLAGVDPRIIGLLVEGSAALIVLSSSLVVLELLKLLHRQHPLFFAVRISERARIGKAITLKVAGAAWIALFVLASPVIAFVKWGYEVEIPTPVVYPGVGHDTWGALATIWKVGDDQGLADLSDYVAHRAYQAGLSYGRTYSFPIRNGRVYETKYTSKGDRIVARASVVRVFTTEWLKRVLNDAAGVARLLEDQPGTVLPVKRRLYDLGYPVGYVALFWMVTLAVLLPASFLRHRERIETLPKLSRTVTVIAAAARSRRLKLPERPWKGRRRAGAMEERRDLVSRTIGDGDG